MKKILSICVAVLFTASFGLAEINSVTPIEHLRTRDRDPLDEDNCPPQTIVSVPITINGNTSASAHDFDLPCAYNVAGDDIYALSLDCAYDLTVSLCGSGYDTMLGVYAGTNYFDCPGTLITCNDDYAQCGFQSLATFHAEAGEFYFIVVSGYSGNVGAYALNVSGTALPPDNDNCSGAILINALPFQHFGSTACANNSFTPACSFSSAPDVLYRINMPCGTWMTLTTCGHPLMDAILEVKKYGACPGTNPVACNDDFCANNQSSVTFYYEANQDYYVLVDGWSTSSGYYVLHATGQTNQDNCIAYILELPYYTSGDTRCAQNDYSQCNYGDSPDEDFTFQGGPECELVTVSLCGTSPLWDSVLEIRTGPSCPGDSVIACNDDGDCGGVFSLHSSASFMTNPGVQYYVIINGYYGSAGPYNLAITTAPCELPAPEHLVIQFNPGEGWNELNWNPVANATSYNVYRFPESAFPPGPPVIPDPMYLIGNTGGTGWHDPAYPPNPCLIYAVTAVAGMAATQLPETPAEVMLAKQQAQQLQRSAARPQVEIPPWVRYEYGLK